MKQDEQAARNARCLVLRKLFDRTFLAAVQSGLLINKAVIKACEAVDGIEQIEAARNRVVTAQLNKEFGDADD